MSVVFLPRLPLPIPSFLLFHTPSCILRPYVHSYHLPLHFPTHIYTCPRFTSLACLSVYWPACLPAWAKDIHILVCIASLSQKHVLPPPTLEHHNQGLPVGIVSSLTIPLSPPKQLIHYSNNNFPLGSYPSPTLLPRPPLG